MTPFGTVRLDGGAVTTLDGYDEGGWWVQDAAATLPVKLLADLAGKRVLDLCAAPGGKTMQLAAAGAEVTALDISKPRMRRMRENLLRTRTSVKVVIADALDWEPDGEVRRHSAGCALFRDGHDPPAPPDLPYLKSGSALAALAPLQDALLQKAYGWLARGGTMVYATCSLLPEEGEARIDAFLGTQPDARLVPIQPEEGIPSEMVRQGMLRTLPSHWPDIGGLDGFFAARIERA